MSKYIKLAFTSLIVIILQISLFNNFTIFGRNINLILMYLIFYSQLYGKKTGLIISIINGLVYDILLSSSVGLKTLGFVLSAYIIGYFSEYIFSDKILVSIFYGIIATLIYKLSTGIIYYFLAYNFTWRELTGYIFNLEIILNVLMYITISEINNKYQKKRRLNAGQI